MNILYAVGDRVRVSADYHWAKRAAGTVELPPPFVTSLATGWDGHVRQVSTLHGSESFYWVAFDDPQRDADGDGPYGAGEIPAAYLTRGD